MRKIDLNCDLGEGAGIEDQIMPFISSANISCGYHAGNISLMTETIRLCIKYNVAIGAHPSFPDRENFGRTNMNLPLNQVYDLVVAQINLLQDIAHGLGAGLHHVKPHGALYNMSAQDQALAGTVAQAVKACDPSLILYGLSGSCSITAANTAGIRTAAEVFADRTYQSDGSLTPRKDSNALITDTLLAVQQAKAFAFHQPILSVHGDSIFLKADTICLHGDGVHAAEFAKNIFQGLQQANIVIGYA
jgi:UPF0271 protein